jgi:hypothetical protein
VSVPISVSHFDRSLCCNRKTVLLMIKATYVLQKFIPSREILQLPKFYLLSKKCLPWISFSWASKEFHRFELRIIICVIAVAQPEGLFHIGGSRQPKSNSHLKRSDKLWQKCVSTPSKKEVEAVKLQKILRPLNLLNRSGPSFGTVYIRNTWTLDSIHIVYDESIYCYWLKFKSHFCI